MAAWRYEISLLMLKKYFTLSLRSLVKYVSTLELGHVISSFYLLTGTALIYNIFIKN